MFPFRQKDGQEPMGHQVISAPCLCIDIHVHVGETLVPVSTAKCLKQLMILL